MFVGERFTSWKMNSMNHNNSCKLVDFHQTCPLLELQKLESEIPFIVRFLRVTRVAKRVFVGERFTSWKMNSMNHNNSCKLVDFHQTCPLLELQKLESEIPFIVRWSRKGNFVNHVSIFLLSTVKRFIHHADIGASKIPSVVASVSSLA